MRKAIAIDFDGCLCANAYPAIGEPNWPVIDRARQEQQAGAGLILWTCREGQLLQEAVAACESWGLTFDALNESLPDWIKQFGTTPRKVGASEYWDDKAVRLPDIPPPNAPLTLEELREMNGEPVWFCSNFTKTYIWRVIWAVSKWTVFFTDGETGAINDYGKTWLAYRQKPDSGNR